MKTDYYIIFSLTAVTLLLVAYGVVIYFQQDNQVTKLIGFNIGLAFLLLFFTVRPLHRNYLTLTPLQAVEWVSVVIGVALYFGLGLAYYFV